MMHRAGIRTIPQLWKKWTHRIPKQVRDVAGAFSSKGAAAAVQFLQSIILSRSLGPEALGLYYVALSVYRVAETAAPLGLPTSTVREVAAARAHEAWGSIRDITRRSALLCAGLALCATLLTWVLATPIAQLLEGQPKAAHALRFISYAMVPGCVALALTSVLRGLGRQSLANLLGSLILPLVATACFLFLWGERSYLTAVYAFIIGQVVTLLVLAMTLWRTLRHKPGTHIQRRRLSESALSYWIVSLASLANDSLAILMLGFLASPEQAGYYGIAARIAMPLSFLGASVQAVCDSRFAGLHRLGNDSALVQDYRSALRAAFAFSLLGGVGLLLLLGPLLALFGAEFAAARPIATIILGGVFLLSAFGPAGSLLTMTGRARVNALTAVIALPLMAVMMIVLVPAFGALGAAIAASTALSGRVLVQLAAAHHIVRAFERAETAKTPA